MNIASFPFTIGSWSSIPKTEHKGETGIAYWQVQMLNDIRVRLVEYSPAIKPTIGAAKAMYFLHGRRDRHRTGRWPDS